MITDGFCVRSVGLPAGRSGELLSLSRNSAGWEWMSFLVRRVTRGEVWENRSDGEERALVLLGGRCEVDWGNGPKSIGERATVFDGLPYALYLPAGSGVRIAAETECELAVCSVPSSARLEPRLVTPRM